MNKKIKPLKITINNQKYLFEIIKKYPKIKSGRKNYHHYYIRILKNILLTTYFNTNIKDIKKIFLNKLSFGYNKTSVKINLSKKNN